MLYLFFIIEYGLCILWVLQTMLNLTFPLVKVCKVVIERLLNFSFLCGKGNLITTNFVSSNNYFNINNSSFSASNLIKMLLINLTGQPACRNVVFIHFSSLLKSVAISFDSFCFFGHLNMKKRRGSSSFC